MWDSINRTGYWQGEIWDRHKDGEVYPKWLSISAVRGEGGRVTHYVGSHIDISERKLAEEKIQHLAFYDYLTDLPNRLLLMDRLHQACISSQRNEHVNALLLIDMDNFKNLNDTLGHDIGDLLLKQVTQRLLSHVRVGDTVARQGGDEFVVMLTDLNKNEIEAAEQTEIIGQNILRVLSETYELGKYTYHCTASIGVSLFSGDEQTEDELLKQADIALYQAKRAGRNSLRFFDPQMQTNIDARVSLEAELHTALHNGEFQLYYQVQVDEDSRPFGAEALIRWDHPQRGIILPGEFISLAEETGLILPIGLWVLEAACERLAQWQRIPARHDLSLAVNVSARQFHQPEFVAQVREIVSRHGVNPRCLKLELTEGILLEKKQETIAIMNELQQLDIQIALDDFGTGYSSLSYLKSLALYQLKIDQSFVRDIAVDPNDRTIVRTIIAMAQSLDLNVIAEGVETEEQWAFLRNSNCNRFQGYLFGRPMPVDELEELLQA
jgi:diguanylate cyclase (GGDEF)-like protein